jgi:Ca2+-binding RTX toxin-like protein
MSKIVEGTNGNDFIDFLYGSTNDDDQIYGYGGHDWIFGLDGDDILFGMQGNDYLFGGYGSDTLKGGGGADYINGGWGSDTAAYGDSPAGVTVSLFTGSGSGGDASGDTLDDVENLLGSSHADTLIGDNEDNELDGQGGNDELKGYGGDDDLFGQDGHDSLNGGAGYDTLHGGNGNDVLNGGPNDDWMYGGIGNDIYIVDSCRYDWTELEGDLTYEYAGQGNDTVRTSVSYRLTPGAEIEALETTNALGTGAINLWGNATNNNIIGNDGDNYIDGEGGSDHMTGRGGNDIYIVDTAGNWIVPGDRITEAAGGGQDEVRTSVSWTLTAGAYVETLCTVNEGGNDAINLTGNETGNIVRGNDGSNVINGGAGGDWLTGLGGPDWFRFDTPLNAITNVDIISDFSVAADTILLDNAIFSAFANGPFAAERFVVGTGAAALDANDNIIYNSATGAIYYDSDGNGAAAAVQFAWVAAGTALTHLDFIIV